MPGLIPHAIRKGIAASHEAKRKAFSELNNSTGKSTITLEADKATNTNGKAPPKSKRRKILAGGLGAGDREENSVIASGTGATKKQGNKKVTVSECGKKVTMARTYFNNKMQ